MDSLRGPSVKSPGPRRNLDEDGFGSINETYKEAKKQLNSITIEDTKQWLEKQKGRQTKAYKGFNSYFSVTSLSLSFSLSQDS